MGLISWFKGLFSEKEEEQVVEEKKEPVDYEVVRLLESYDVKEEIESLEKVYNVSESIQNYVHNLQRDLENIRKEEKANLSKLDSSILKIRKIVENILELENQLAQLIEHYHNPIIEILKKVNEIKNDERIAKQIEELETHKEKLKALCNLLKTFVEFQGMFDEEVELETLQKDFETRVLHGNIYERFRDLKNELTSIITGTNGLKTKINIDILKDIEKILYEE
jgi:hypothetical protein